MAGAKFPRDARLLTPDAFSRALKTRPFRGKFLWIYRLDRDATVGVADLAATSVEAAETKATDESPSEDVMSRGKATVNSLANTYRGPQLGMMIGKRNAKTAVLRNAIKRRIREQFRLRAAQLPAREYVVRLSKSASKADTPFIVGEWVNALDFDIKKKTASRLSNSGQTA